MKASYASGDKQAGQNKYGVYFPLMASELAVFSQNFDEKLYVKDTKVDKVIVLGRVVAIEQERNRWSFKLDDCTGFVTVHLNKLPSLAKPTLLEGIEVEEGMYVKTVCMMKPGTEPRLIVDFIEEIKDFNMVTNHLLSCVHAIISLGQDVKLENPENGAASQSNGNAAVGPSFDHLEGIEKVDSILSSLKP